MVLGIGVDILKLDKLKEEYLTAEDPFIRKAFSEREFEQSMSREVPLHYFVTRFAGKEAVYKALNWRGDPIAFRDIEILSHENGQPYVTLHGRVKEYADNQGIHEILISLSYDTDYAIAYAVAQ